VRPTPTIIRDRVGALIVEVMPGTPAEAAGLRVGDMIVSVDRQSLVGDRTLADVIGTYRPGDEVTLTVLRNGRTQTIPVRLVEHPDDPGRAYLGVKATMLQGTGPRQPSGD
jgi:S1-C subfamily serine protease